MRSYSYLKTAFLLADLILFFIRTPAALAVLAPAAVLVRIVLWLARRPRDNAPLS